jgi:hypothetical protein
MKKKRHPIPSVEGGKAEPYHLRTAPSWNLTDSIDTHARIRWALLQAKKRLGRPADEVFDELESEDEGTS